MKKPMTLAKKTSILILCVSLLLVVLALFLLLMPGLHFRYLSGWLVLAAVAVSAILYYYLLYRPAKEIKKTYAKLLDSRRFERLTEAAPVFEEQAALAKEIRQMVLQQKDIEMESVRTELLVLQNQINPHFLYNTLESIRSDALYAGLDSLAETARSLATFFRYTISERKDVYPVALEIDNIENYFLIQRYRFGDKLRLELEFLTEREPVLSCLMPKLTLQPIVENAIIHGLDPISRDGVVTIRFVLTEKKLIIAVKDNGIGIPEEKLLELNRNLQNVDLVNNRISTVRHGVALRNVNHRIKLLFGEEYGIHILSGGEIGIGTEVRVSLPIVREEQRITS